VETDIELLARRSRWAADTGDDAAADRDLQAVRRHSAGRGRRLDIELRVARGDATGAWGLVDTVDVATADDATREAWARLRVSTATAAGRWQSLAGAITAASAWLTPAEQVLADARLAVGRDGVLSDVQHNALDALVRDDSHRTPASVLLAAHDVATGAWERALARLPLALGQPDARLAADDLRHVAAQALRGLERHRDIVDLIGDAESEPVQLQIQRAQALTALGRVGESRPVLARLATVTSRADAWLALADTTDDQSERLRILADAVAHLPERLDVRARLADARWRSGDADGALADADVAIAGAGRDLGVAAQAWRVRIAVLAARADASLRSELDHARGALGVSPDAVYLLADATSGAALLSDDVVTLVDGWLRALPDGWQIRTARVQAQLGVGSGRWTMAREAVDRLRLLVPGDASVRLIDAQVTAWSGAHAAAVPLYAAYLAEVPGDVRAWRDYARLLTWRQDVDAAASAYARLQALTTTPGVRAEARTKAALLRHAWHDAVTAARAWRVVEPGTLDAMADLATALEQDGDVEGARAAYADLSRWPGLPATVQHSIGAFEARQAAHGAARIEADSAEGVRQQRLIGRRESVLSGDAAVTASGRLRATGRWGSGTLDTGQVLSSFTQAQLGVQAALAPGWSAEMVAGGTRVGSASTAASYAALLAGRIGQTVGLELAVSRRPFWENGVTVAAGLQATNAGVRTRLLGRSNWEAEAGVQEGRISDGNTRQQLDLAVARQVFRGAQQWDVRGSAFVLGFDRRAAGYFSPSAFGRFDLDTGVTRWLGPGASVRDGRFAVRGRLGAGIDTDGVPYALGSAGVLVPVGGPLSLAAESRWTSARTYRAWSAGLWLQVRGPSPR
ncbi:MAG: hypothetical protein ACR2LU_10710, partial [Luteitalea sp.]